MKIGSIVYCINNNGLTDLIPPKLKTPYTVRGINSIGGIWLEEIINPISPSGIEWFYKGIRFREVQFPPSLESEIEECLTKELQTI